MSIDVEHLSFSYGRREVLHDLTFSIPDNTLVNVLGPNGVGKSTLFRCILCLNRNWEGGITVNGKDLRALSIRDRASEIAYIPQSHAPVYNYEVLDVVLMSAGGRVGLFGTPKRGQVDQAWNALERIGIAHLCSSRAPSRRTRAPSSWTSPRVRSTTATPCGCCRACGSWPARA